MAFHIPYKVYSMPIETFFGLIYENFYDFYVRYVRNPKCIIPIITVVKCIIYVGTYFYIFPDYNNSRRKEKRNTV